MKKKMLLLILLMIKMFVYSSTDILYNIIFEDILTTIKTYNNNTCWYLNPEVALRDDLEEIDIDTIRSNDICNEIYKVQIRISLYWYSNIRYYSKKRTFSEWDTLTYYIVKRYNTYYKLFGFYNTDINGLFYNEPKKELLSSLVDDLVKNNILSLKESRYYKRSILKNQLIIHRKVNKPCEYLKIFYDDKPKERVQSNILRERLLLGTIT